MKIQILSSSLALRIKTGATAVGFHVLAFAVSTVIGLAYVQDFVIRAEQSFDITLTAASLVSDCGWLPFHLQNLIRGAGSLTLNVC